MLFDDPRFAQTLFFPSRDPAGTRSAASAGSTARDETVPAADGTPLRVRVHDAPNSDPDAGYTLLCFPGNGEHAGDYDPFAPRYLSAIVTRVVVAEYRGYGKSGGEPSFSALLADARTLATWVAARSPRGWIAYGRSLGSQAACEALGVATGPRALVIDAGFGDLGAFVVRRGFSPHVLAQLDADERRAVDPCAKVAAFEGPVFSIHGDADEVIDFRDGRLLNQASKHPKSQFSLIHGRGHNDLFYDRDYFPAIEGFVRGLVGGEQ